MLRNKLKELKQLPHDFEVIELDGKYVCEVYFFIGKKRWAKGAVFETRKDAQEAGRFILAAIRTIKEKS